MLYIMDVTYPVEVTDMDEQKSFTILLAKPDFFRFTNGYQLLMTLDFYDEATVLPKSECPGLEDVWKMGQGDFNENLQTRSLSVGDLVRDNETGKLYYCDNIGWKEYVPAQLKEIEK